MGIKSLTGLLLGVLICGLLFLSHGCSGGDGGDGSNTDSINTPNSTIQGNVAQVLTALRPGHERPSHFARWHDLFRLVPPAYAQTATLAGITVVARQGSTRLGSVTTDAVGNFTLQVVAGTITLEFTTATFTVTTDVLIPAASTVVLVVMLQPTRVVIPTQLVVEQEAQELPPIRCTGGRVQLLDEGDRDVTLDGGGDDCLRAEGNCTIDLTFRSVTLTNCQRCLRAEGNASIHLTTTTGAIQCTASADGIRAQGTAQVRLDAGSPIALEAAEHGIRAAGTAEVLLNGPACVIDSDGQPIRREGNATVTGCGPL
jgi:hypothetical protein